MEKKNNLKLYIDLKIYILIRKYSKEIYNISCEHILRDLKNIP